MTSEYQYLVTEYTNIGLNPVDFSRVRGRLGTILPLSINIGILTMLVANYFLSYLEITCIAMAVLFLFVCTFTFFPDTPRQLYKIRRKEVTNISIWIL